MNKRHKTYQPLQRFIVIGLAIIISSIIIFNYIYTIKTESDSVVAKGLSDQMNQSNNYISEYLESKVNLLENVGKSIKGNDLKDDTELQKYLKVLKDGDEFNFVGVIDDTGSLTLSNDKKVDVRTENYYYGAIQGKVVISKTVDPVQTDYDAISISVPIYDGDKITGVIFAIKDANDIQNEITKNFDTKIGFCYIIDSYGHAILRAQNQYTDNEFINFYHYMAYTGVDLGEYAETVRSNLAQHNSGVIAIKNKSKSGFLAYDSISQNSDWAIVSYLSNDKALEYGHDVASKSLQMTSFIGIMLLLLSVYFITQEIGKKRNIEKIFSTDPLTKINNLNGFISNAKKIRNKYPKTEYVMVVLDINKFRYINHIYSYMYGDEIIKEIAKNLSKRFNNKETCGRVNADNFVVFAKYYDGFAEELNKSLEVIISFEKKLAVSYRIGLYICRDDSLSIEEIMDKANCAWKYVESYPNKNIKFYDESFMKRILFEEKLEQIMENALGNREFKVYMQSKVDLKTEKICGAEALARWDSAELGFIVPDKFIPLFEKNGFVVKLDFYMLEEIFKKIIEITGKGLINFTISVNQSRATICNPQYINKLTELVNKYDIDTSRIELEVTESILTENHQYILSVIEKIRTMGFMVSMDDFGSGYSSLNTLKDMPINELKLDRMFLSEEAKSDKTKTIIKKVIEMARELNINSICEGVETQDDVQFLKEIDCNMAQGYYYGKPMPIEAFEKIIYDML